MPQDPEVGSKTYEQFLLPDAEKNGLGGLSKLPFSLKVLAENLLRFEDGRSVTADDIRAVVAWLKDKTSTREIAYRPDAGPHAGFHRRAGGGRPGRRCATP